MNPCFSKTSQLSLIWLSLTPALAGCHWFESLPFQDTKIKIVTISQQEKKDPEVIDPEPQSLSPARLVRRLTLDIAQRLPFDYEVEGLSEDPDSRTVFIESLLAGSGAAQAIAAVHARMWHLNSEDLPDLDDFAATQESFKSTLTAVRQDLIKEPLLLVRQILADRLPFSFVLAGKNSIMPESARDFWQLPDAGQAWPDDNYRIVEYTDDRPEAGILATNGWLSAFSGRRQNPAKHRSFRTLAELTCRSFEGSDAHLFARLSDSEFDAGLDHVSLTNKDCAGCHLTLSGAGPSFSGLGSGATFDEWKTYSSQSSAGLGSYHGEPYSHLGEFAKIIGNDPQFLRCERDKIVGSILQRPIGPLDQAPAALVLDRAKENPDLLDALLPLFDSKVYAYGTISPKIKGAYVRQASGIRLLRRHHFESLARLWAPSLLDHGLDLALEPGIDEVIGEDDMIPTGPYWHAVDKIASQLAHAIVTKELAPNVTKEDRLLLDLLPSGTGHSASDAEISSQIMAIWKELTSESLAPTGDTMNLLKDVWTSAGPVNNASAFRTAWSMVLYAILTHPQFLTY